ncbi:MAG: S49 family peptidase [Alphaproteobacteria bacterium]|nr:S49 family peptidase [Alphaproteobacteria bacterium]
MREFWFGVFGSILGMLVGSAMIVVLALFAFGALVTPALQATGAAESSLDALGGNLIEIDMRDSETAPRTIDILEALYRAQSDPAITGAILLVGGDKPLPLAHGESVSRALDRLSRAGKPVTAFLQDAGTSGLSNYIAASRADEIWASPLAIIQPGAAGELDRFLAPQTGDRILGMIANARGLSQDRVAAQLQSGAFDSAAALDGGLIDQLGSSLAARAARLQSGPEDEALAVVSAQAYLRSRNAPRPPRAAFALISIDGPLTAAAASRTATEIDGALRDDQVRAIVLHVDSQSGSAPAAFEVADAIMRAQAAGKPVVALAGAAATGAAYYALSPADQIITPSLAALVGLGASESRLPASLSPTSQPPADSAAVIDRAHYAVMLEQVADARDLPLARVAALGRGQIWSGADAVSYGLADLEGGLDEAVTAARSLSGLAMDEPVGLIRKPERSSTADVIDQLIQRLAGR